MPCESEGSVTLPSQPKWLSASLHEVDGEVSCQFRPCEKDMGANGVDHLVISDLDGDVEEAPALFELAHFFDKQCCFLHDFAIPIVVTTGATFRNSVTVSRRLAGNFTQFVALSDLYNGGAA